MSEAQGNLPGRFEGSAPGGTTGRRGVAAVSSRLDGTMSDLAAKASSCDNLFVATGGRARYLPIRSSPSRSLAATRVAAWRL
jgi:hypothetical protein